MKILPTIGFDQLRFGMKLSDVESFYGTPDQQFEDEEGNSIAIYYALKSRLTFYSDEDDRLGYIIVAHPQAELEGVKIGTVFKNMQDALSREGIDSWEKERFDSVTNYFNEANWIILQEEFGTVAKVEIGALINDKDEFVWHFPKKK